VLVIGLLGLLSGSSAQAEMISLSDSGWLAEAEPNISITEISISGNTLSFKIEKRFTEEMPTITSWTPLLIDFEKDYATNITEIVITEETVTNNTQMAWHSYKMAIVSAYPVKFSDLPSSMNHFATVNFLSVDQKKEMVFANGIVPKDDSFDIFETKIDVSTFPTGRIFTLKEWPSIPEPVTLITLILGGLGMIRWRK
jgi:hypothetical protein